MAIQAASVYVATFTDLPAGTYTLRIPPVGSFGGYQGSITIDHDMPAMITLDVPESPDPATEPDEPGPPLATPVTEPPTQTTDTGTNTDPGPVQSGDASGSAGDRADRSQPVDRSSTVTALPSTGSGTSPGPSLLPLGSLLTASLLILLRMIWAGWRSRR